MQGAGGGGGREGAVHTKDRQFDVRTVENVSALCLAGVSHRCH